MLVTSIYNMADTLFVSQLGTSVSGATGVVFALMAVINAFGFMFGHGAGSNISRKLGAYDLESARVFASTSFFLSLLAGSYIGIFGFLFHVPFMRLLGSTDSILPYALEYSTWILSHLIGLFGIQTSQTIADGIAAAITIPMVVRFLRRMPEDGMDFSNKSGFL